MSATSFGNGPGTVTARYRKKREEGIPDNRVIGNLGATESGEYSGRR